MYTDHISPATMFLQSFSCLSNWRFSGQNKVDSQRTSLKHCIYVTRFKETHYGRMGLCQSPMNGHPSLSPGPRLYSYQNCSGSELYVKVLQGTPPGGMQALSLSLYPVFTREKRGFIPGGMQTLSTLHPQGIRGCIPWGYTSALSTLYPRERKGGSSSGGTQALSPP